MCSGSYFPPAVRRVAIPKPSGGERISGIPTVGDRIAHTAAKVVIDTILDPIFHDDSFGYRPGRSALDAVALGLAEWSIAELVARPSSCTRG